MCNRPATPGVLSCNGWLVARQWGSSGPTLVGWWWVCTTTVAHELTVNAMRCHKVTLVATFSGHERDGGPDVRPSH
jgi:hypothetical protein